MSGPGLCGCGRPSGRYAGKRWCCVQCPRWGQHTHWCDRRTRGYEGEPDDTLRVIAERIVVASRAGDDETVAVLRREASEYVARVDAARPQIVRVAETVEGDVHTAFYGPFPAEEALAFADAWAGEACVTTVHALTPWPTWREDSPA